MYMNVIVRGIIEPNTCSISSAEYSQRPSDAFLDPEKIKHAQRLGFQLQKCGLPFQAKRTRFLLPLIWESLNK